ncbi:stage III sporulation protein AG [Romboutsia sp.]|uniref:stage III sporulation protein AG n=1 Tax=Romboutsia sp. TaxID=1965302 RepID=UPI003F3E8E07
MFKNLNEKDKKKIYSLLSLAVVCAIALIVISGLPGGKEISKKEDNAKQTNSDTEASQEVGKQDLENKLKKILAQIKGVGDLDVMITFESSEEIQPAYNSNSTTEKTQEKDKQGGERTVTTSSENKTMITSSSNGPIVIKTNEPKIKGVLVVASGASDPTVKENLYNAVQVALQISGHQVEIYIK